jgi:cytochrome c oxidase assembly protein subunit 15
MWGRAIGLAFILPGSYFALKGYMTPSIKYRSLFVALMIGSQGRSAGMDDGEIGIEG